MYIIEDIRLIRLLILAAIIYIIFLIIRSIFRIIKWFFSSIWYLLTGKRRKRYDPLKSGDWLTRAQARQEIRFQNSLPSVLASEMKKERKPLFKRKKKQQPKKNETVIVDVKFANNPDWKWDEKAQLWRHRSQWDKIEK